MMHMKPFVEKSKYMRGTLRIAIGAIKELIQNKEIEAVTWIQQNYQLADPLTKRVASPRSPLETITIYRVTRKKVYLIW